MKNITNIIILTLLLAAGAYWFFFTGGEQPAITTTASSLEAPVDTSFPVSASELQSISFKTDIFDDTRFTSLIDLTTAVTDEQKGRLDPFAVVPGVTGI
jgi:hypothetical protein